MRRGFVSPAVLGFVLVSVFAEAAERPAFTDAAESSDSVVSVVAFSGDGSAIGFGGGFVVNGEGLVVSAWGIVKQAHAIRVFDLTGQELAGAKVLNTNEDDGYALIQLADTRFAPPPVSLGNSDLVRVGDSVVAVSVPLGFERTVLTGHINGWTGPSEPPRMLTTLPRTQGMVGGPLFNQDGDVIGLNLAEGAGSRSLPINRVDIASKAASDLP